ncbi:hypothetical protein ANCDUO_05245 [Ancylostoma duodenale]|uniref:Uncharacterized protein n=1 Tax=Ancylostoma duodenale TaxID=51022 RepID=A0A0C2GT57_9BILA|nr:hypothetical protein ANCDUO_05245 [Ancylostoma duodenale]
MNKTKLKNATLKVQKCLQVRACFRSKEGHKDKMVTWTNVLRSLAHLSDGSLFLHAKTANLHRDCENGLKVLVANGTHKVLPRQLGDNTQLCIIHGVCRERTPDRTGACHHREKEQRRLRRESSSERGEKKVSSDAIVKGCPPEQSLERKRNGLGLTQFIKGRKSSARTARLWSTPKGLEFQHQNMHCRIIALTRPPVPPTNETYRRCKDFLDYLHTTWLATRTI